MINPATRAPAVAGMFYPGSAAVLMDEVQQFMANAKAGVAGIPKALIVPHAGYVYSGPVAASAYACLAAARGSIKRVVLLGPTHRVAIRGLALPATGAFDMPLGRVTLDAELEQMVLKLPQVQQSAAVHAQEHSLEVQLPFLQMILDDFTLLPLAVGMASAEEVAEVLDCVWGGRETLIVISSDLSHYHPYAQAQQLDQETARQIVALQPLADHQQACGATPINGLLLCARHRGMQAQLLDLRNSGDTAGDRSRVVGYGAFAFQESPAYEQ
ncbi:MAG: AmmeMemoRadiSam system protein B [Sterolibacterium sp.]